MAYTEPVKFSATDRYGCGPCDEDDVYTVEEFRNRVKHGSFIDYDGYSHPVKNGKSDGSIVVLPSSVSIIPADATHIVWFNC